MGNTRQDMQSFKCISFVIFRINNSNSAFLQTRRRFSIAPLHKGLEGDNGNGPPAPSISTHTPPSEENAWKSFFYLSIADRKCGNLKVISA